ncbi:Puromycin-sensitive aminopeptidase [Phytophthora fragariae]|uniref:Aminopeptidase n=1 Tax=Phytophthora fragariae TaxID=53985 RepID=A0A6A3RBN4_9STRA|nr:Puromycin-sensitive aminopeptidase [Phytophthora fragariae]KAE8935844.1 Puromycin-sensitive aminopeptidase [Phytophthora fragariae]KAE8994369.1 Puromycin-sensitive aminopeptidase [Phytophthora fragariae]KAE9088422.1 Puromycin-sensitive aminopeptidase [Phytophthora fragariae]KAE9093812.1 Puromycin-sensitive aminopeptidase [Phytophthora fragariae]
MAAEPEVFKRLPSCVVPEKYHVDYELIDLLNFRFEGSERVQLRVTEAARVVTCHAVELHVFDVSVEDAASAWKTQRAQSVQFQAKDDSVSFHFAEPLAAGSRVTLTLQFHGFLNDQLRGFYRTEYDNQGERRVLAVTQFEACDARRAFVCWDEPALKATFEISMVTDVDLVALSNAHVVETRVRPRKNAHIRTKTRADVGGAMEKVWKFAESPVMSTYLVAMVVGEFDMISDVTKEGVVVNVYTAPGQSARGRFALDVATKALSFFTESFGIPYPLKKLDMVSIPDFLGAMENWGLVTYTETYLLVDPKLSSHEIKADAARAICHELSHQWFGNLVTMDWWTGLWLNEGFAQFMEFEAAHHIFPEWKLWETFVQDIMLGSAFVKDAMVSSHPIEVVVNHPQEADEIFDAISYHKGSSVVRMLSEYLGRDVFLRGVHDYLVKFSYKNTVTEDLWEALEKASGQKLKDMADTWTKQVGFPLVTVKQDADGKCVLVQERFFADASLNSGDDTVWDVALTFCTSDDPSSVKRLGIWDAKTASLSSSTVPTTPLAAGDEINQHIQVPADPKGWIKLNPNQASFYLVNYSPALWKRLEIPVKEQLFGVPDRVSLLSSVFTFARAGVLDLPVALDFTNAYVDEYASLCWKEISRNMGYYSNLFREEPFYPELQRYIRSLFAHVMKRLGWDANGSKEVDADEGEFRKTVINRLGLANDQDVIKEAKKRFHAYLGGDSSALSGDLRGSVFDIEVTYGDAANAKLLQELHNRSDFAEERRDCLDAIGSVSGAAAKLQVLEWAVENVRSQDIHYPFISVSSDKLGSQVAWQYVQDKWDFLAKKYSAMTLGSIVCGVVSRFKSEAMAVEVDAFMVGKDTAGYKRRLEVALEGVRLKSAVFCRDRESLAKWLKERAI